MDIQLSPNFVWTILVAKGICIILMFFSSIVMFHKYRTRKTKIPLWLAITFSAYLVATILTFINTIIWYIDFEWYKNNLYASFNGIFMTFATTALLKFTFIVFYENEEQSTTKRGNIIVLIHFLLVLSMAVLGVSWIYHNGVAGNPFGTAIIALAALTYIILINACWRLIHKITKINPEEENIKKLKGIRNGAILVLLSVILIIMDFFVQDINYTGYTWLSPLGYATMAYAMWILYKSFK